MTPYCKIKDPTDNGRVIVVLKEATNTAAPIDKYSVFLCPYRNNNEQDVDHKVVRQLSDAYYH